MRFLIFIALVVNGAACKQSSLFAPSGDADSPKVDGANDKPTTEPEGIPGYLTDPQLVAVLEDAENQKIMIVGRSGAVKKIDPSAKGYVNVSVLLMPNDAIAKVLAAAKSATKTRAPGEILARIQADDNGSFSARIQRPNVANKRLLITAALINGEDDQLEFNFTRRPKDSATPVVADPADLEPVTEQNPLVGRWETDCLKAGGPYNRYTLNFAVDGTAAEDRQFYDDPLCSIISSQLRVEFSQAQIRGAGDGKGIDFEFSRFLETPMDGGEAGRWAANSYCGISTWVQSQPQDVTGRTCIDHAGRSFDYEVQGDRYYTGMRLESNDSVLVLPAPDPINDGTTELKRTTDYDQALRYKLR